MFKDIKLFKCILVSGCGIEMVSDHKKAPFSRSVGLFSQAIPIFFTTFCLMTVQAAPESTMVRTGCPLTISVNVTATPNHFNISFMFWGWG